VNHNAVLHYSTQAESNLKQALARERDCQCWKCSSTTWACLSPSALGGALRGWTCSYEALNHHLRRLPSQLHIRLLWSSLKCNRWGRSTATAGFDRRLELKISDSKVNYQMKFLAHHYPPAVTSNAIASSEIAKLLGIVPPTVRYSTWSVFAQGQGEFWGPCYWTSSRMPEVEQRTWPWTGSAWPAVA
jgi:hypothetical protein